MIETLMTLGLFLVVVLILVGLVKGLGLGAEGRLLTTREAAALAEYDGLVPVAVAFSADGSGALVRDEAGRWLLVRRHGVHFITRLLEQGAVQPNGEGLTAILPDQRVLTYGPPCSLVESADKPPSYPAVSQPKSNRRESWA